MADAPEWSGSLKRGEQPNTIEGWLEDKWKWRLHILGTRNADGTYTLRATVGDKGTLRIPLVNG